MGGARYYSQAARQAGAAMARFGREFPTILDEAIRRSAYAAAEREVAAGHAPDGTTAGEIAEKVRAAAYERRPYGDGDTLGERLEGLARFAHEQTAQAVAAHSAGDANELSEMASALLEDSGRDNVRFRSLRLLVTEAAAAFRAGQVAAVTQEDGRLAPRIAAIGWRLSGSHGEPDECDEWAEDDSYGLGAGNYPSGGSLPDGHPFCRCVLVSVTAAEADC